MKRKGYALVLALVVGIVLGAITVSMYELNANIRMLQQQSYIRELGQRAAESGFEHAVQQLGHNYAYSEPAGPWLPCPWSITPYGCEYSYSVINDGSPASVKIITANGKITLDGTTLALGRIVAQVTVSSMGYTIILWDEENVI